MKKTQFESLVIHDFEEDRYHLAEHGHTYYELIYIRKGKGVHLLNQSRLLYHSGDLFVLSPGDVHHFDIMERTHFTFIKFTDSYFSIQPVLYPLQGRILQPVLIMQNKYLKETKLPIDEPYSQILRNLVENIVRYGCQNEVSSSQLVHHLLISIFGLVSEILSKLNMHLSNGQAKREDLLSYIHQHIYEPEKLQAKEIARKFNLSTNYFSVFFRNNFSMNYKAYVNAYKVQLIQNRLEIDKITLKQIADEFGFIDESHLSHFFKAQRKVSPGDFRKSRFPKNNGH